MEHHGSEPYDKARLVQEEPGLARTSTHKHKDNAAPQKGQGRYDYQRPEHAKHWRWWPFAPVGGRAEVVANETVTSTADLQ